MFPKRLKLLREEKGLSQVELASFLGVAQGTIGNWETAKRQPDFEMADRIADFFDVSLGYLLGSEEERGRARMTPEEEAELGADIVAELEQEHMQAYLKLDEHGRAVVDAVTSLEIQRINFERDQRENQQHKVIPIWQSVQPVSAGKGVYLGPEALETIYVEENSITHRAAFAVPVQGNSMEPLYHNGDVLLVGKDYAHPGEIGVFTIEGEGYVKKLGNGELISLNPEYVPIPFDPEAIKPNGKVIGTLEPEWIVDKQ